MSSSAAVLPEPIWKDLFARFLSTASMAQLESAEHFFLLMQNAWWFYIDYHAAKNQPLTLPQFCYNFLAYLKSYCELYQHYFDQFDMSYARFESFNASVPKCGTFFLNQSLTHCLLVREKSSGKYGIPKGKCFPNELPIDCARREFVEEVGFDFSPHGTPQYLFTHFTERPFVLFVLVSDFDIDLPLPPSDSNHPEIQSVEWMPIQYLFYASQKGHKYRYESYEFNASCHPAIVQRLLRWTKNKHNSVVQTLPPIDQISLVSPAAAQ